MQWNGYGTFCAPKSGWLLHLDLVGFIDHISDERTSPTVLKTQ